jgi:UDP-glucose 4,6-dehydratase
MIILFGSTGYIGSEFKRQLEQKNIEFKCWPNAANTTFYDLEKWYEKAGYPIIDAVINASGYTGKPNVDACETNKDVCIHANIIFPQILTDWCVLNGIPLGHVSSGCIYYGSGPNGTGFTEEDEPNFSFKQNNCSIYSGIKVLSENMVRKWEKSYVWRLRMPFEEYDHPRNLISKMLKYQKQLKAENSISHKQEFVNACIETIIRKVPYGTYNVTNTGYITTELLVDKLKKTIAKDKVFELIDSEEFYKSCASTPRSNCILDNSKLLSTGIKMSNVEDSLNYCLNNWKS